MPFMSMSGIFVCCQAVNKITILIVIIGGFYSGFAVLCHIYLLNVSAVTTAGFLFCAWALSIEIQGSTCVSAALQAEINLLLN